MSEFFHLLQLERQVGVSASSLRKVRTQMEEQILEYQRQRQAEPRVSEHPIAVCASVDETFFEQAVLVMLDLSSGFILVEELSQDHRYSSWQQWVQPVLRRLKLKVRYCVSDRAKALVKLALSELGCPSIADLFHALRELSQGVGRELAEGLFRVNRRLHELATTQENAPIRHQLQTEQSALQTAQQQYRAIMHQLTTLVHPFAINGEIPQSSSTVKSRLHEQTLALKTLQRTYSLSDKVGSIAKFERQQQDLSLLVDL